MLGKLWNNRWQTLLVIALIVFGAVGKLKLLPLHLSAIDRSKVPKRNFDPLTCLDTTLSAAEVCPADVMSQQSENIVGVYFIERPPPNTPNNLRFFTFALVNHSSHDVEYWGYVPESFDPNLAIGEVAPLYSMSVLENGEWKISQGSLCGFGSADMRLRSGRAGRFKVHLREGKQLVKIGVHCFETGADGSRHQFTIWSEPVGNDPGETP